MKVANLSHTRHVSAWTHLYIYICLYIYVYTHIKCNVFTLMQENPLGNKEGWLARFRSLFEKGEIAYIHVCIYVSMYVFISVPASNSLYIYMYVCAEGMIYIYIYIYIDTQRA